MTRAQLRNSVAMVALGVTIAAAPEVSAQPGAPIAPSAKQRIAVDRAKVVPVQTRAAIAHLPFPMVDPQTNKPVAPTQIVVGLKGEHVTAQAYWDNVNKLEKYLNDRGLSQRTAPAASKIEVLHEDDALVQGRLTKLIARRKPISPAVAQFQAVGRAAPSASVIQRHFAVVGAQAAAVPYRHGAQMVNKDRIVEKTITQAWPFGSSIGGDFFGAEFGGEERIESHEFHRTVTNTAHANGSVFGHSIALMEAQVTAKSAYSDSYGGSGSAETDSSFTMTGVQPFPPAQAKATKADLHMDRKSLVTHTWSPDFPSVGFGVGPFSVDIAITIAAHAEIDAAFTVLGSSARAALLPSSSLNVAISAGVSIPGVEVGVDGKMRVFDHHFELDNEAELVEPGREAKLTLINSGTDRFDALSGSLAAFVKVGFAFVSKKFEIEIFSKPGIHEETQFLSTNQTLQLMPPPPPAPPSPLNAANAPVKNAPPPPQGATHAPAPHH